MKTSTDQGTTTGFLGTSTIRTPNGQIAVERLKQGDIVSTFDNGNRPILWVGAVAKRVSYLSFCGRLFSAGTMIMRQPKHAENLYGTEQVLVETQALHQSATTTFQRPRRVFQLVFHQHELIEIDGLWCASFFPSRTAMAQLSPSVKEAVEHSLPTRDHLTGYGYGPTARPTLRDHEYQACSQATL